MLALAYIYIEYLGVRVGLVGLQPAPGPMAYRAGTTVHIGFASDSPHIERWLFSPLCGDSAQKNGADDMPRGQAVEQFGHRRMEDILDNEEAGMFYAIPFKS